MHRALVRISAFAVLLGPVVGTGCREIPADPGPVAPAVLDTRVDESAAREFYPLSVGNLWSYHRDRRLVVEVIVGPPYKRVDTFEGAVERRIEAEENIEGVTYFVEAATLTPAGRPPARTTRTLFRQDHSGLYASDLPASGSSSVLSDTRGPAERTDRQIVRRALGAHERKLALIRLALASGGGPVTSGSGRPGGLGPDEILTLGYPLHKGAVWYNRIAPFVVRSIVEAPENLDLPAGRFPAWRVRVESEFLDPEDRVVVWYGRSGRLAMRIHTETLALDAETGETALITSDDNDVLTGLALDQAAVSAITPGRRIETQKDNR